MEYRNSQSFSKDSRLQYIPACPLMERGLVAAMVSNPPLALDKPISIIIPVYNEAENIVGLVEEIRACLDHKLDYEIIVADDGSTDDTLDRLQDYRDKCQNKSGTAPLRVIRHHSNLGKSTAIHTGIIAAKAEWIVTLDGDGQNDPADIPRLLEVLKDPQRPANLQLICGYRYHRQDSWLKRFSSRIANAVRGWLLGDGTPDTGCGLKLVRRQAFLGLPFFDHMHRFLPALIQRNGGCVVSIKVNHRPRVHGKSKYGVHNRLWAGIVDLVGVLWLKRRAKHPIFEEVV